MQEKQSTDEHNPAATVHGDVRRSVRKRFQFSIARLLGVTAMVALTFGVARMLLDKEISRNVIPIAVLAAVLGMLVLVAQKKSDFYRIIRVIVLIIASIGLVIFVTSFITLIMTPDPLYPISKVWLNLLVLFVIGMALLGFSQIISWKITKIDRKNDLSNEDVEDSPRSKEP